MSDDTGTSNGGIKLVDGAGDAEAPEPVKRSRRRPKLGDEARDTQPLPENPPTPGAGTIPTETAKRAVIYRRLPPAGWQGSREDCQLGRADVVASHDPFEIAEEITRNWGGGIYDVHLYDGDKIVAKRQESVAGEPLPLREEESGGGGGRWAPPGGGFFPHAAGFQHPYQHGAQPFSGVPPHFPGAPPPQTPWAPPSTSREDELEAKYEKLQREREEERRERKEAEREARHKAELREILEKVTESKRPPAIDPMIEFMKAQMQAAAAQAQADREARAEQARREEADRKDRLEREERERREEREEQQRREDREERRRAEDRKEREAREERLAKEQREFMTSMAQANSPEKLITMLSTLQKLTTADKDPVDQIIRLEEARAAIGGGGRDDEDEKTTGEKIGSGLAKVLGGVGDYMAARAAAPPEPVNLGTVQGQHAGAPTAALPGPGKPAPAPAPNPANDVPKEVRLGRLILFLRFATDAYKKGNDPESTANALKVYARSFVDQGHVGVEADLGELVSLEAADRERFLAALTFLRATVTSQAHVAHIDGIEEVVNDDTGLDWIRATMRAMRG